MLRLKSSSISVLATTQESALIKVYVFWVAMPCSVVVGYHGWKVDGNGSESSNGEQR
jgi:hypothetical protein